jgi:superfamily II DNA/RNA helicase
LFPLFIERLASRGIREPTEIQKQVIPLLVKGEEKKLLFRSPTGTGKTFAYLLPLLGRLIGQSPEGEKPHGRGPALLICAPTYELCSQIKGEADFLLNKTETSLKTSLLIGQGNMTRQIEGLKKDKPVMVVGNPGRLLVLARMGKLALHNLRFLILDEGDRLVSDELLEETRELVELVHQKAVPAADLLMAACSATFSPKSKERLLPLFGEGAKVMESWGNILKEKVEHWAFFSEERHKLSLLCSFINAANPQGRKKSFKALIFTARGREVGKIVSLLQHRGLGAAGLWGDMKKEIRKQSLEDFRSGRIQLLVTSDLAARGLDIPGISHIIALDLGEDPDAYIHRAGRTARAGATGIMVTIGHEGEMRRLAALEKRLGITVYPKELYQGKICTPGV